MFTGIIQTTGRITQKEVLGQDMRLHLHAPELELHTVQIGDSIAVQGVCLTVITLLPDRFGADVSNETLSRTTLGALAVGSSVNLEKALTPQTPLGGHLVSGHVDGIGKITQIYPDDRSKRLHIRAPDELAKYIASKGSICVDGASLTVNTVQGSEFTINIIPHTLTKTTFDQVKEGEKVNLEVDIIARYLERLLLGKQAAHPHGTITESFLKKHGFA